MPRQYRVFYKRGATREFSALEPGVHASIYRRPQITDAVEVLRHNPFFEGIALRIDDEMFNIITFEQDAMAPRAFVFEPPTVTGLLRIELERLNAIVNSRLNECTTDEDLDSAADEVNELLLAIGSVTKAICASRGNA